MNDSPQTTATPLWKRWEIFGFVALMLFTLVFRVYGLRNYDVMSADGTSYALSGKSFIETWSMAAFGTVQPPLYPMLVGLLYFPLRDMELAARLVSVIFSTFTLVPLYLLGREMFGRKAGFIGISLFVSLPFIHSMSGIDITEPTFTFFAISGGYLFYRAWLGGSKLLHALAGLLLGLSYLARPEGFIITFVISFFFCVTVFIRKGALLGELKKALPLLILFWGGFSICAFPYMNYLHGATGQWQLSGKSGLNAGIIKELRGFAENDQHLRLDANGASVGGKGSLTELIVKEPEVFWLNVRENLRVLPGLFTSTFPLYFWPMVLAGLFFRKGEWQDWYQRLVLLGMFAPLSLYVLFFIQPRGFYAYVPLLLVLAGGGFARIDGWLQKLRIGWMRGGAVAVPVVVVLCTYYLYTDLPKAKPPYDISQDGGRFDDKQVGIRLRTIIPEGVSIMTRSGRIAFYAQRQMVLPPQSSYQEIILYARQNKVPYIIATLQMLGARPQLSSLYGPILAPGAPFTPPAGLELVYSGQEPGGLPYLVYRIKGA